VNGHRSDRIRRYKFGLTQARLTVTQSDFVVLCLPLHASTHHREAEWLRRDFDKIPYAMRRKRVVVRQQNEFKRESLSRCRRGWPVKGTQFVNPSVQFQQPQAGCTVQIVFTSGELGYEFLQNMR
jgi:hypothetical protein